jgi:hypothetical protein
VKVGLGTCSISIPQARPSDRIRARAKTVFPAPRSTCQRDNISGCQPGPQRSQQALLSPQDRPAASFEPGEQFGERPWEWFIPADDSPQRGIRTLYRATPAALPAHLRSDLPGFPVDIFLGAARGQPANHLGADAGRGFKLHVATVQFDEALNQRQPETDTGAPCFRLITALEPAEDTRLIFFGNTDAGIGEGDDDVVFDPPGRTPLSRLLPA